MEKIKGQLIGLFDEMKDKLGEFGRKTYAPVFEEAFLKYKDLFSELEELCLSVPEEEREEAITEIASLIPGYVKEEVGKMSRFKKGRETVDCNMNMAVYVVPMFMYMKTENCALIGKCMVELWNKSKISSSRLKVSSFEEIAGGFPDTIMGFKLRK